MGMKSIAMLCQKLSKVALWLENERRGRLHAQEADLGLMVLAAVVVPVADLQN
jgi:hypothetical protein